MRKYYVYVVSFLAMIIMVSACYTAGYNASAKKMAQKEEKEEIEEKEKINNPEADSVNVQAKASQYVQSEASLVLRKYNKQDSTVVEEVQTVPAALVGLTKEQVEAYVDDYMQNITLTEYLEGLCSYELVSFSSEKLILKKTYDTDSIQFLYYILEEDGEVVVYYSDKKTVYQYTGIRTENLAAEEKSKLKYGILVRDEKELFGLLENYSS